MATGQRANGRTERWVGWGGVRRTASSTENFQAFNLFLKANQSFERFEKESDARASELLAEPIALDPNFAMGGAFIGWTHLFDFLWGWSDDRPRSLNQAEKGAVLDMIIQAVAAWLHFSAIFITVAALGAELVLFRREMSVPAARLLSRIDGFYGIGAGLILLSGLSRVFWFGKGAEFYGSNPLFWVKMGLFAILALLSLPPTIHFIKWRRELAADRAPMIDEAGYRRIRRIMWLEAVVLLMIPLLATSMARGIGM